MHVKSRAVGHPRRYGHPHLVGPWPRGPQARTLRRGRGGGGRAGGGARRGAALAPARHAHGEPALRPVEGRLRRGIDVLSQRPPCAAGWCSGASRQGPVRVRLRPRAGLYRVESFQRPCDGNCSLLDPPTDRCSRRVRVYAGESARVRIVTRPGQRLRRPRRSSRDAFPSTRRVRAARRFVRGRAMSAFALIDTHGRLRGLAAPPALRDRERGQGDAARRAAAPARRPPAELLRPRRARPDDPGLRQRQRRRRLPLGRRRRAWSPSAKAAGMRDLVVPGGHWGNVQFSAADQARLFLRIDRLVPPRSRPYALRLLSSIVSYQRWGFSRFSLRRGWHTYFKGGWRQTGLRLARPRGRSVRARRPPLLAGGADRRQPVARLRDRDAARGRARACSGDARLSFCSYLASGSGRDPRTSPTGRLLAGRRVDVHRLRDQRSAAGRRLPIRASRTPTAADAGPLAELVVERRWARRGCRSPGSDRSRPRRRPARIIYLEQLGVGAASFAPRSAPGRRGFMWRPTAAVEATVQLPAGVVHARVGIGLREVRRVAHDQVPALPRGDLIEGVGAVDEDAVLELVVRSREAAPRIRCRG